VVPAARLEGAVRELVDAIASSSADTVATGKRAFYAQIDQPERDAYDRCEVVMTKNALAPDAQEGIDAFVQKRAPNWRGH
jgi:enoyl-CoA hydratase/carnithine racemase